MEDKELISLWKAYDKRVEESLVLNRKNAEDITMIKVKSLIASMKPIKIFTLVAGVLWVGFVDLLLIHLITVANPFFLISAGIQVLLTKLAIGVYVYQLILIDQVDINKPIVITQEKIARLKSSTIWVTRFLFLQFPVWTTFYWSESMFKNGNSILTLLQALITISFTFLSVWLFRNISDKNRDRRWFNLLFTGNEWEPLMRSMSLLEQIKEYKNEDINATIRPTY